MVKIIQRSDVNPYNKHNYEPLCERKGEFNGKSYTLINYQKNYTSSQRACRCLKALALILSTLFFGLMNKKIRKGLMKGINGSSEKQLCIYEPRPSKDITTFIKENYKIKRKGNDIDEDDLSHVEEFLLCDHHGSPGHNQLNSQFINNYATENDTIMVEAVSSMKKIQQSDSYQSIWLDTKALIVGWDSGSIKEVMESDIFGKSGDVVIKSELCVRQLHDPAFTGDKKKVMETLKKCSKLQLEFF